MKPQYKLNYSSFSMTKTIKKARSAETGRFITMEEAIMNPNTTVVEKVKIGPVKHRKSKK